MSKCLDQAHISKCLDHCDTIYIMLILNKNIMLKPRLVKLQILPLSHIDSVHPAPHPLSHRPVTWLQLTPSLQYPTQG